MPDHTYIIIAGINKGGTTSLFDYLSAHPDINPSYVKQTFYFLDKEWQKKINKAVVHDYEDGYDTFDNYFGNQAGKYNLEASPDYLYVPGTAERLADFFKTRKGKIIFILREPVSRFNSLFYFGKQQGLIPNDMKYSDFYEISLNYEKNKNPILMGYKTGFYSKYLKHYIDLIGKEKLCVLFFEDLKNKPKNLMQNLSEEIGVDKSFYENFEFKPQNTTIEPRSKLLNKLYGKFRYYYMKYLYKSKIGIKTADVLKNSLGRIYKSANFKPLEKTELDEKIIQKLKVAYQNEKKRIEDLTGHNVPW